MGALDTYIQELNNFSNNLEETVVSIGKKNEVGIVKMQNDRLFSTGTDAKGNLIGNYSPNTIARKRKKGQPVSHVTLKDSGGWYGNMFVTGNNELLLENKDASLTTDLMNGGGQFQNPAYGKDIIGLTDNETIGLVKTVIDPELQQIINKQTTFIEL